MTIMSLSHTPSAMLARLPGGPKTIGAFCLILVSYTTQTESMQYIQHNLGYSKPLFLLYVTHSSFLLLLPAYLLCIHFFTSAKVGHVWNLLKKDLTRQVHHFLEVSPTEPVPRLTWVVTMIAILFILTVALTIPSISWFLAVPFTSMANITSIYNTFSLWALVFSVYFLKENWDYLQACAVLLGVVGVSISATGSAVRPTAEEATGDKDKKTGLLSPAFMGDLLALIGAISMAAYEILYKRLTEVPETSEAFIPIPSEETPIHDTTHADDVTAEDEDAMPFGVHALAMTTGIGLVTLCLFWIPLFFAHMYQAEPLEMPRDGTVIAWIALSATCGVLFNGSFAILLSLWGPVLASMSCLLTTVLVQLTDMVQGIPFTWMSILGNVIITVSFLCLLPW